MVAYCHSFHHLSTIHIAANPSQHPVAQEEHDNLDKRMELTRIRWFQKHYCDISEQNDVCVANDLCKWSLHTKFEKHQRHPIDIVSVSSFSFAFFCSCSTAAEKVATKHQQCSGHTRKIMMQRVTKLESTTLIINTMQNTHANKCDTQCKHFSTFHITFSHLPSRPFGYDQV